MTPGYASYPLRLVGLHRALCDSGAERQYPDYPRLAWPRGAGIGGHCARDLWEEAQAMEREKGLAENAEEFLEKGGEIYLEIK